MESFQRLLRNKTAVFGMIVVIGVLIMAALADVLAPYPYDAMNTDHMLQMPSWQFPFGTDQMGRDVLSRVLYGSRISIYVGFVSTILGACLGIPLGIIAAYYGGIIDHVLMRIIDIWVAFPIFLLALVIMVILGPSVTNVVLALAIVRVPTLARVIRGTALSVKENDYIQAARALGSRDLRLLLCHILPNCIAPVLVLGTLEVATAILVEAGLSFLGMGTQPPTPSWGWDLRANVLFIEEIPWIAIMPGLAIFITVLGFNMFGDGLRDALDPRLKEV
jgi:peptide/nickel transport system permease protein